LHVSRSEVGTVYSALHVRVVFPLRVAYPCQLLPRVNGVTVSEYYELIRLPKVIGFPTRYFGLPTHLAAGTIRVSQVLVRFSRHMPRSLWTPADPRKAHQSTFFVLTSGPLKPSSSALGGLHHRRNLRGYIKTSGSTVFLVAYVVPCVRFNDVVRSLMSDVCVPGFRLAEVADIPAPTPRFSLLDGHSSNRP